MAVLPDVVLKAWESHVGPFVFTTVNPDGIPNAIYANCVWKYGEDNIIVANNYFDKTLENIRANSKGSILFLTKDSDSYQIKGSIEYHEDGPIYDAMKSLNPEDFPGHAAAALKVDEVYCGEEKLV